MQNIRFRVRGQMRRLIQAYMGAPIAENGVHHAVQYQKILNAFLSLIPHDECESRVESNGPAHIAGGGNRPRADSCDEP
jgi:hypothetical protein